MSNTLVIDVETTTFQKGNPYSLKNKLVCIGFKYNNSPVRVNWHPDIWPVTEMTDLFSKADTIIGFNLKFDLAWLERYGLYDPYRSKHRFWDTQLVDFLLSRQSEPYPSLDSACAKYGLGSKLDTIVTKYWDNGIDTDQIPREELKAYCCQDIELTYELYKAQKTALPETMAGLVSMVCQDMSVLQQMESNGLLLASSEARELQGDTAIDIAMIEEELKDKMGIEVEVNWDSTYHRSAMLYGGIIEFDKQVQVGFYKTGMRKNQPKMQNIVYKVALNRVFEPVQGSELSKDGYWSTDEATLSQLQGNKDNKRIIYLLNKRSELSKLTSTYLEKWPKLVEDMDWDENMVHGSFHQCVAITGRLSSSRPNLQNPPDTMKQFIRSRYV